MPRFSVVVPAYNAEATLSETLDAIVGQEFADWECVVVDDGSTDDTAALGRTYSAREPRIHIASQANQGTAGAYNTGVALAQGEFITICSADDLLLPSHLSAMNAFIVENNGYDIYSCNGYYLFADGHREPVYTGDEWRSKRSLSLAQLAEACFFGVGATFRTGLFRAIGGFRIGVYGEDYDFWLRALSSGAKHCYSPAPTALHRISASQKSASLDRVFTSDVEILEAILHDPALSKDDVAAVREVIAARALRREEMRINDAVRAGVNRVLGRTLGNESVRALRRLSWLVRPAKVALARRRLRSRS